MLNDLFHIRDGKPVPLNAEMKKVKAEVAAKTR